MVKLFDADPAGGAVTAAIGLDDSTRWTPAQTCGGNMATVQLCVNGCCLYGTMESNVINLCMVCRKCGAELVCIGVMQYKKGVITRQWGDTEPRGLSHRCHAGCHTGVFTGQVGFWVFRTETRFTLTVLRGPVLRCTYLRALLEAC